METPPYTPQSDQDTPPSTPHVLRHNWEEALRAAAEEDYSQGEIEAAIMASRGALDQSRQPARRRRASPSRASEGVGESEASIRPVHRGRQTSSRPASRTKSPLGRHRGQFLDHFSQPREHLVSQLLIQSLSQLLLLPLHLLWCHQ